MARRKVSKPPKINPNYDLNQQAANALLGATFDFLRKNNIPEETIIKFVRQCSDRNRRASNMKVYRELEQAQEDMGLIIGTWFSHPKFLDSSGGPLPLSIGKGPKSIAQLVRASGAQIQVSAAVQLMRQSRSVKLTDDGSLLALRRAFVLPRLEVIRAAFVIERYLDTLSDIASGQKKVLPFLLERSCHVSKVDLAKAVPLLRDIERRGTAFMDSIDGELEARRLRRSNSKNIGEVGVHVFLWTRPAADALTPRKRPGRTNGKKTP